MVGWIVEVEATSEAEACQKGLPALLQRAAALIRMSYGGDWPRSSPEILRKMAWELDEIRQTDPLWDKLYVQSPLGGSVKVAIFATKNMNEFIPKA